MENEEELNKAAWETYREAIKGIDLPDYVSVSEKEDGTFSLVVALSYKSIGSTYIFFKPSIEVIKDLLTLTTREHKNLEMPIALSREMDQRFALLFANLFIKEFIVEIEETLSNLNEIPFLLPMLAISKSVQGISSMPESEKKARLEKTKNDLEEILEKRKQRLKKRILEEVEAAEKPHQPAKHLIAYYYEGFLPEWEQAKDCYKKNKKFGNWEKAVAVNFENLPSDLIKRLGDPDRYTAMPSSIALEHAARICGIPKNSLGLRALQKYLQQSRDWAERVGKEEVEKEAGKYFRKAFREVITYAQVSYSLKNKDFGKDFDFENDSLVHQIIAEVLGEKIKSFVAKEYSEEINDEQDKNSYVH